MKLYFLRHAEAEDGPVDAERRLTLKGRRDSRQLGRYLDEIGVAFDLVYASPLVRAQQTAKLVLKELPGRRRPVIATVDELLNDTGAPEFARWLIKLPRKDSVLFVGHEPSLSSHVRRLLGIAAATALPLAKGAVARIDSENRRQGTLKMLLAPKHLA